MDKNLIITISFLIKFAVRIFTLYYTFHYKLQRIKNRNQRISQPKFSEQNKDHECFKNTQISFEKLILQELNYDKSIPWQFFFSFKIYIICYTSSYDSTQQYFFLLKYIYFAILLVTIAPSEVKRSGQGSNHCLYLEPKKIEIKGLIMCKQSRIMQKITIF